jgi:Domain of unknown function (DUF5679)
MLSKRVFWLACAAVAIWLIWLRLRQRQIEFASSTPQFAPPRTFAPPIPAAPPISHPDPVEASTATPAPAPPVAETLRAIAKGADMADVEASTATPAPAPPATDTLRAIAKGADMAANVSEVGGTAEIAISGYCMRCKTKRLIQNAHRETTESGRPAARGTCPICGSNMFTFLATNDDA